MVEPLSIQEMLEKTEPQRKNIQHYMDSEGTYDFELANLYTLEGGGRIGREDEERIRETLRGVPLDNFLNKGKLKEMMASSGTTGIAGARYLIPDKIHTTIFDASVGTDLVPYISPIVTDIPGQSLKVDIGIDGSYIAKEFSSGGKLPDDEIAVTQTTITPISFGIALRITNDMLEDTPNVDLINWHLNAAGIQLGNKASDMALFVLKTAQTEGDGTLNTQAAQADETTILTINSCIRQVAADKWQADVCVGTTEAFHHSVFFPVSSTGYGTFYQAATKQAEAKLAAGPAAIYGPSPLPPLFGLNFIETQSTQLYTDITSGFMTNAKTIVLDKDKASLTGRKRWARIERYSDPIRDLVGAVISSRQDTVTVYNDAICVATES